MALPGTVKVGTPPSIAILGGVPTFTVPGRANEFHTDFPPNSVFKIIYLFKFKVKQIKCVYCQMLKYFYEKAFRDRGSGFAETYKMK